MTTVSYWNFDRDQLEAHSNQVKDCLLMKLVKEGIITDQQAMQYSKKYVVAICKKSIWSYLFNKDNEIKIMVLVNNDEVAEDHGK